MRTLIVLTTAVLAMFGASVEACDKCRKNTCCYCPQSQVTRSGESGNNSTGGKLEAATDGDAPSKPNDKKAAPGTKNEVTKLDELERRVVLLELAAKLKNSGAENESALLGLATSLLADPNTPDRILGIISLIDAIKNKKLPPSQPPVAKEPLPTPDTHKILLDIQKRLKTIENRKVADDLVKALGDPKVKSQVKKALE